MSKGLIALAVLVALAGIVLFSSVYTVHQTQQALLLTRPIQPAPPAAQYNRSGRSNKTA